MTVCMEYEQQERDLLDRRGLPVPEPDPEPAPEATGQVRQAAPDVLERPSPGAVQHDAPKCRNGAVKKISAITLKTSAAGSGSAISGLTTIPWCS